VSVTYTDLSAQAKQILVEQTVKPFVEACAVLAADAVQEDIYSSRPAGRHYRNPGTTSGRGNRVRRRKSDAYGPVVPRNLYQASAPGQPPAEREAVYRKSWNHSPAVEEENRVVALAYSDRKVGKNQDVPLGLVLEEGTDDDAGKLKPRPHASVAVELVQPRIQALAGTL
jgi:hypothetical protein